MEYYNFIEIFGERRSNLKTIITDALQIRNQFRASGQQATITPHSPYSVPPILMKKISNTFDKKDYLLSVHMQETESENELFENKKGIFYSWLNSINASSEIWDKRKKSTDICLTTFCAKIITFNISKLKSIFCIAKTMPNRLDKNNKIVPIGW